MWFSSAVGMVVLGCFDWKMIGIENKLYTKTFETFYNYLAQWENLICLLAFP